MKVENLGTFEAGQAFEADIAIVGGGPAGITIAREFIGTSTRVLILESGEIEERPRYSALNQVESVGEPFTDAQRGKRIEFRGANSSTWSQEVQPFGVRCRAFGGSTHAWAGKSAPFDPIDFSNRDWVPNSGWPLDRPGLDPYIDRAGAVLNLGPMHGEDLWEAIGVSPPAPPFDAALLRSFFWQFARSKLDNMDMMRFGSEALTIDAPNVRVLVNATVTEVVPAHDGASTPSLRLSTIDGATHSVSARIVVLAASGIENPRLLLTSDSIQPGGLGNAHDTVGRYLMDHPGARIGRFGAKACAEITRRFGFYGLRHGARTHMYMHGLAPSEALQHQEGLLNSAVYMLEERAPDDPWDALKRILRARSSDFASDILAIGSSPSILIKGLGMKMLESGVVPAPLKNAFLDGLVRYNPNFVVREFQSRGLPHKLTGIHIDAISEQSPDRESRITLSDQRDALGVRIAKVDWRISGDARRTLVRLGHLISSEFDRVGLPHPELEPWVRDNRPDDSTIIDMGHTLGTTRMSDDARAGVVNHNCRVHGVSGVYVAGGSVFPTSGHANPTLMILALAIRLADHLKGELRS